MAAVGNAGIGDLHPVQPAKPPLEVSTGIKIAAGAAMAVLIVGIVATFFGHAHIPDDGSGAFANPFYAAGIAAFVIGGMTVLGLAAFQLYKERSQHDPQVQQVKEGWRKALQSIQDGCEKAFAPFAFAGRTFWSYIKNPLYMGLSLTLLGASAVAFAKLHEGAYGTGEYVDKCTTILGGVVGGLGMATLTGMVALYIIRKRNEQLQQKSQTPPPAQPGDKDVTEPDSPKAQLKPTTKADESHPHADGGTFEDTERVR